MDVKFSWHHLFNVIIPCGGFIRYDPQKLKCVNAWPIKIGTTRVVALSLLEKCITVEASFKVSYMVKPHPG